MNSSIIRIRSIGSSFIFFKEYGKLNCSYLSSIKSNNLISVFNSVELIFDDFDTKEELSKISKQHV